MGKNAYVCQKDKEPCPEWSCYMFCEFGYEKDANGCEICECKPPPEEPMCLLGDLELSRSEIEEWMGDCTRCTCADGENWRCEDIIRPGCNEGPQLCLLDDMLLDQQQIDSMMGRSVECMCDPDDNWHCKDIPGCHVQGCSMGNAVWDTQGFAQDVITSLSDVTLKECEDACLELSGSREECAGIEHNSGSRGCVLFSTSNSFSSPGSGSTFSQKLCGKDTECRPVNCFMFCEFGYELDDNGCETCSCNPFPRVS